MLLAEDLRKSVLQAAIQGRLTEQLSTDSSVDELLEKIKIEKEQLIKDKKIKKEKVLGPISKDEIPFDIPENWRWIRLGSVAKKLTDGAHKTPKYTDKGVPFLSVKDMSKGKLNFSDTKFISIEEHNILYQRCNPEKGDLLITKVGTTGIPVIVDTDKEFSLFVSVALMKFNQNLINIIYLYYLIKSPMVKKQATENTKGVGNKNWVLDKIANTIITIPPIEEQQRIVERIEELMQKIDEYEKYELKLNTIKKAFPLDMKKSLLQAAIQGKLTEQLDTDSSVDELLQKIKNEKEQLIKEKKIKKEKILAPISEDEIPFDIPENWRWARMNSFLDVRDGTHDTPKYVEKGIPLITSKNISNGFLDFSNVKYISQEDSDLINKRSLVEDNDILLAMIGSIGNPVKVKKDREFSIKNVALIKSVNNSNIDMDYIVIILKYMQDIMKKQSSGGVQKFVSLTYLREFIVPLPPIEEQRRIVEKLDVLLPRCEELIF